MDKTTHGKQSLLPEVLSNASLDGHEEPTVPRAEGNDGVADGRQRDAVGGGCWGGSFSLRHLKYLFQICERRGKKKSKKIHQKEICSLLSYDTEADLLVLADDDDALNRAAPHPHRRKEKGRRRIMGNMETHVRFATTSNGAQSRGAHVGLLAWSAILIGI